MTNYIEKLYSAALRKCQDSFVAEELVQETCLAAIQARSRGKEIENEWSWLLTILSNKYYDWLREKYNKPQVSFEEYPLEISEGTEEDDDTSEKMEAIRRELGYLAKTHREVMVRYYMHNETVEQIAAALQIPEGTVKSRLSTGRKQIREGVGNMENYVRQSYEPDMLHMSCSGGVGYHEEPFSLVKPNDTLTQNLLLIAYAKPVTPTELAKALGVPVVFLEPIIEKLLDGELMKCTESGKVYTDFIIYTERDRKATFQKQLSMVEQHFEVFWRKMEPALKELREQDYYQRQTEHAKTKLELHFCIKVLLNAHIDVRNEITGAMPYSEYPYRKNGGRWFAMGQHFAAGKTPENERKVRKYGIDGERGAETKNFRDLKLLDLREYGTDLGRSLGVGSMGTMAECAKWFYELLEKVPEEESSVGRQIMMKAEDFLESGFLIRTEEGLALDIPVLMDAEYNAECRLAAEYEKQVYQEIREVLLDVFRDSYVKLPAHLKSVPKWMQYMFCGNSVPMAVIYKAMEKDLLFQGVDYPIPASILVIEKA